MKTFPKGIGRRLMSSWLYFFILAEISYAQIQSSPSELVWKQTLEHSLQTYNYQPVLDEFQKAQSPADQEMLCLKTAEFAEHAAKSSSRAEDVFYSQKVLLFLCLCRKEPASSEKIEAFCRAFSSAPGLATALREAADVCFYLGKDVLQARQLYQRVLETSANETEGLWAQRGLVMTAIEQRDFAQAEAETGWLLKKYSQYPQIDTAVRVVADRYLYANQTETAGRLYTWLAARPDSEESIWVLRGLAVTRLRLADYAAADTALERLQKTYVEHPQFDLALREAADEYFYWGHDSLKAQSLYRQILQSRPEGSQGIWARLGLVLTAIELGERGRAQTELNRLLSQYEAHEQIATAVRIAADRFFYFGNDPELACALYERILQNWPESSETMAARRGLAMVNARLPDAAAGKESVEKLLMDFAGRPEQALQTAEVLQEYCRAGRPDDVLALSEKILQQNPSRPMRLTAYTGLARACIQMGQEEKAGQVLQMLLQTFSEEAILGQSLFVIGEEYYLQGGRLCSEGDSQKGRQSLNRAVEIWEMIPRYSTDSQFLAHALYYTAAVRQQLGQYEQAIADYQKVLLEYPAYEKAWFAQFQAACCSEELLRQNRLSKDITKAAYRKVLEKYPFCPAAQLAAEKLKRL